MSAEHRNVSMSRRHFDRLAREYDSSFIAHVPTYAEMHNTILEMLGLGGRYPAHVLELGIGTGTLTEKLLDRFPKTRVTGVDISPAMLTQARAKLSFAGNRVELRESDMSTAALGSGYDAVVSAIAFHHVPPRKKAALFAELYGGLDPDGVIVVGDTFKATTSEMGELFRHLKEERLMEEGLSKADIVERSQRAKYSGGSATRVRDYERWLAKAGFISVDCVWKHFNLAVLFGRKPGGA